MQKQRDQNGLQSGEGEQRATAQTGYAELGFGVPSGLAFDQRKAYRQNMAGGTLRDAIRYNYQHQYQQEAQDRDQQYSESRRNVKQKLRSITQNKSSDGRHAYNRRKLQIIDSRTNTSAL